MIRNKQTWIQSPNQQNSIEKYWKVCICIRMDQSSCSFHTLGPSNITFISICPRSYIFAAHRHRQVGQNRGRTDPQEKPAAELHHVKMNNLLQNLLREIVQWDGIRLGSVRCLGHCVKRRSAAAKTKTNTRVSETETSGFEENVRPKQSITTSAMCRTSTTDSTRTLKPKHLKHLQINQHVK